MVKYKVIGLMSGSSMDGLDIAYCEFKETENKWSFEIIQTETVPYDVKWRVRLSKLRNQSTLTYVKTDVFFGHYIGQKVNEFIDKHNIQVDLIASHGHTVFHYPEIKITAQIGDGASISAVTNLPVVSDFRRMDLAKGGQGAPLVTIGDKLLFGEYDYCINLGGFANISGNDSESNTVSFDICPCNIPLNRIARDLGKDYDQNGDIAANGNINYELLSNLNGIVYYSQKYPKSLNRDWINQDFWPIVREFGDLTAQDKMKTLVDHIAVQVTNSIDRIDGENGKGKKILVTGGSAYNTTLIEHIKTHTEAEIIIPNNNIIDYKEALIFGFLGIMRINNQINTLSKSTGSFEDSIGGGIHGDYSKFPKY